jgi:hypothetical protein
MSLLVQIDGSTAEEIATQVADLHAKLSNGEGVPAARRGRKSKEEVAAAPVSATQPAAAVEDPMVDLIDGPASPPPALVVKKATIDDCKAAAQSLLESKGRDGLIAVNKKFGVGRVSDLTEDKYSEFVIACSVEAKKP